MLAAGNILATCICNKTSLKVPEHADYPIDRLANVIALPQILGMALFGVVG